MKYVEVEKNKKKNYKSLVKHNYLIQGKYYLTGIEQKLLYKIFEEVQQNGYKDRKVKIIKDSFYKEYKSVVAKKISNKDIYDMLADLQDKKVFLLNEEGVYIRTQWYSIHTKPDLSDISIVLDEYVFKYIQSLNTNFTKLRLETLYSFKSFHSMRIYEILKQWCSVSNDSEIAFKIDTFKELVGIDEREEKVNGKVKIKNKGYKNFNNIKVKVLDPAVEEINEKSEINISYTAKRKGTRGKVEGIIFKVWFKSDAEEVKNVKVLDEVNDSEDCFEIVAEDKVDEDNNKSSEDFIFTPKYTSFEMPSFLHMDEDVQKVFKLQYWNVNFKDAEYMDILFIAQSKTFKKDGVDKITSDNWKYFKSVLDSKLDFERDRRLEKILLAELPEAYIEDHCNNYHDLSLIDYIQNEMECNEKYLDIIARKNSL